MCSKKAKTKTDGKAKQSDVHWNSDQYTSIIVVEEKKKKKKWTSTETNRHYMRSVLESSGSNANILKSRSKKIARGGT